VKFNETQIENNSSNGSTAHSQAKTIRIESSKLDELFDSIGELVIAQSFIDQNEQIRGLNNLEINQYLSMLNKTTRLIQNKVMNLRMIPIRDTFMKMKRVSRDVSKKTNKEVELILSGEDTEIDKTMVDSLSEPLIHLIRNSIDHGIEETAQDRIDGGKVPIGKVFLSAMHKGSSFIIEIKDDGRGIDTTKILEKAIEKGIASSDESYTKEQILNFLLVAGFSTAATITDISGRGVGLDAVKQSIESIKGKLQIESTLGEGSVFRIILPLTLAIIDGLSVLVKDETFIIPTLSVVESFRAKKGDVQKAKGQGEFINFRGDILPVLKLGKLLGIDDSELCVEETTLICIEHERGRYVLQVNELLGRQQVVIKSLSKRLASIKEISGAAIMGSGEIALILNIEGVREWLDVEYEPKGF
jgi:two-component system chemotaxis sensor kinase CheA